MKRSRKYLLGTLLTSYAMIFIFVGVNRATESRDYLPESVTVRTPPAELDSFTGYSSIDAQGDFILYITRGEDFAIDYQPVREDTGSLQASQTGQTLVLVGYGNRTEDGRGVVNITLPDLRSLTVRFSPEVTVKGFTSDAMGIQAANGRSLTIAGNTIGTLDLDAQFLREIVFDGNRIDNEETSIQGSIDIRRE